jgi:molybdate transport system regulatory protein
VKERTVFAIQSKIRIENMEGDVVSGIGRYRIWVLDMMGRLGSMHAAVRQLQMRYRAVWMRIRTSEERIGKPLVV